MAQTVARMREFYRQREPQLAARAGRSERRWSQQVIELTRARWSDMPQQRGVVHRAATPSCTPDLPVVLGVESEIREALTNLVFNAVDAMPEGGTLTLRTRARRRDARTPDRVHLEVSDTGVGMDEETRRRCLEPFFTTKGERGTGLGLAMVYGMVQRHGAEHRDRERAGRGHDHAAGLSGVRATRRRRRRHRRPARRAHGCASCVVDDDPLLLKSLRDTLETDGHVVTIANGGQAGIDAFRAAHDGGEPFDAGDHRSGHALRRRPQGGARP